VRVIKTIKGASLSKIADLYDFKVSGLEDLSSVRTTTSDL
jgi:hypothetical protein